MQPQAIITYKFTKVGVGACQPSTEQPNNQQLPRNPSATRPGRRMLFQDWLASLCTSHSTVHTKKPPAKGSAAPLPVGNGGDRQGETLGFPDSRPLSP